MTTISIFTNGDCLRQDTDNIPAGMVLTVEGDVCGDGAQLYEFQLVGSVPQPKSDYNPLASVLFGRAVFGKVTVKVRAFTKVGRLLRSQCAGGLVLSPVEEVKE